jgi:hypothetical protein
VGDPGELPGEVTDEREALILSHGDKDQVGRTVEAGGRAEAVRRASERWTRGCSDGLVLPLLVSNHLAIWPAS